MTKLAGFDVIAEFDMDTIVDLVNYQPVTNPFDRKTIFILGGPFSTDLDLGSFGPLRAILEARLIAKVHQSSSRLVISMTGGTMEVAGGGLHIGANFSVEVPMRFELAPDPNKNNLYVPTLFLSHEKPTCSLDQQTQTEADHYLGAGGAARLADTLANALAHLLSTMPKIWLFGVGFTVVPGVDSFVASQLSAIPIVAWINERTLAAFGYYRASAVGGNIQVKNESDLDLSVSEFRPYDCRQFALLLSAEAFTRLMCPILRDSVIKELMVQRQNDQFHEDITNRYQKEIRDQKIAEHYNEYLWWYLMNELYPGYDPADILSLHAEALGHEPFGDPAWDVAHYYAVGRCQEETDAEIDHRTQIALDNWLMFDAQQAIDAAQPPPCGKGSVDKIKKELNIPGEQRLAELKLTWLGAYPRGGIFGLGRGTIHVHYEAEAFQEDLWGDIWVPVSGDIVSELTVNKDNGDVVSELHFPPPTIDDLHATGLTGTIIAIVKALFESSVWKPLITIGSILVGDRISDLIKPHNPKVISAVFPQTPFPQIERRLYDLRIDDSSISVIGVARRVKRVNEYNPGLFIDLTVETVPAKPLPNVPINGILELPETQWDRAASFPWKRTFWDTIIKVKSRLRDAPLPLKVLSWTIDLGNFRSSLNDEGEAEFLWEDVMDWSGNDRALARGRVDLRCIVNHPDLPIKDVPWKHAIGFAVGRMVRREDVMAIVEGDNDTGWEVRFRSEDGNFVVLFELDAIDGDGTKWHASAEQLVVGDKLELPGEFYGYKIGSELKSKIRGMKPQLERRRLQPWEPVSKEELVSEASLIRTLLRAGDPEAFSRLSAATERYGTRVLKVVALVPGVTVRGDIQ